MAQTTINRYERDTIFLPDNNKYIIRKSSVLPEQVALHYHDHYEILFSLSGRVLYTVTGHQYWFIPTTILIIPPWQLHKPFGQEGENAERLILRFSEKYLKVFETEVGDFKNQFNEKFSNPNHLVHLNMDQNQQISHILNGLFEESKGNLFGQQIASRAWITQLILVLYRLDINNSITNKADPARKMIQEAVAYIDKYYYKPITIEGLAKQYYVNRHYFSRSFSRLVGSSPSCYLLQRRLIEAQKLLSQGVMAQEAAAQSGFQDYSNFYRQFHKAYGLSPSEFKGTIESGT